MQNKIEDHLRLSYFAKNDVDLKKGYLGLMGNLIMYRLISKMGTNELPKVRDLVNRFLSGEASINYVKKNSFLSKSFSTEKIESIFTKFTTFGKIDSFDKFKTRIKSRKSFEFQEKFAQEINLLDAIREVEANGEEVFFRGINIPNEADPQDILSSFDKIHVGTNTITDYGSGSDKVFAKPQGLASYRIKINRSGGHEDGRASYATSVTSDFKIALKYSRGGSPHGLIYEIRPQKGRLSVNMESISPYYSEAGLSQINPREVYAIHSVRTSKVGGIDTQSIVGSFYNPHYKKRSADPHVDAFMGRVSDLGDIELVPGERGRVPRFNKSDAQGQFEAFNSQQVRDFRAVARKIRDSGEGRSVKEKSHFYGFRPKYNAKILEERRVAEVVLKSDRLNRQKEFVEWKRCEENWFSRGLERSSQDFKVFISVDAEDYQRAVEILIKNGNFSYKDLPNCTQRLGSGRSKEIAIVLNCNSEAPSDLDKWKSRLSSIESDLYFAGIKPRPLNARRELYDRKFPDSLYCYFKKDRTTGVEWDWESDNYFKEGESIIGLGAARNVEKRIKGLESDISEAMKSLDTQSDRGRGLFALRSLLRSERKYLEISKLGPEETELIQSGVSTVGKKTSHVARNIVWSGEFTADNPTHVAMTPQRALFYEAKSFRAEASKGHGAGVGLPLRTPKRNVVETSNSDILSSGCNMLVSFGSPFVSRFIMSKGLARDIYDDLAREKDRGNEFVPVAGGFIALRKESPLSRALVDQNNHLLSKRKFKSPLFKRSDSGSLEQVSPTVREYFPNGIPELKKNSDGVYNQAFVSLKGLKGRNPESKIRAGGTEDLIYAAGINHYPDELRTDVLSEIYRNIFAEAIKLGAKTIAIPASSNDHCIEERDVSVIAGVINRYRKFFDKIAVYDFNAQLHGEKTPLLKSIDGELLRLSQAQEVGPVVGVEGSVEKIDFIKSIFPEMVKKRLPNFDFELNGLGFRYVAKNENNQPEVSIYKDGGLLCGVTESYHVFRADNIGSAKEFDVVKLNELESAFKAKIAEVRPRRSLPRVPPKNSVVPVNSKPVKKSVRFAAEDGLGGHS